MRHALDQIILGSHAVREVLYINLAKLVRWGCIQADEASSGVVLQLSPNPAFGPIRKQVCHPSVDTKSAD